MKRLILQTALTTLAVAFLLAVALFGLISHYSPATMMRLCGEIGLNGISGDYAYRAYEREGDISYLAYSARVGAESGEYAKAVSRFEILFSSDREVLLRFCEEQDASLDDMSAYLKGSYYDYLSGLYVRSEYLIGEKEQALSLATELTEESFPSGNPFIVLTVTAVDARDADYCQVLSDKMQEIGYSSPTYQEFHLILEEYLNE